jgi:thiol-disulfide isomerase/thioredoxin
MLRILTVGVGLWLAFVVSVQAAAIKLDSMKVGSQAFTNVTITSYTATDAYFSHSKGVSSAKIRNLEPDVQKLLGYDAAAAQAAEKRQQDAESRYKGGLVTPPLVKTAPVPEVEERFSDPISEKSLLGKQAPRLQVEKWLGSEPKLEGKFVLVSFWSTKSAAARKWIPQLNALQKKFEQKLQIVAITSELEKDVLEAEDLKMEFPSGIDSKSKLINAWGVTAVPYVVLTDPRGSVLYYGHPAALNEKQLQAIFAKPVE